MSDQKRLRELRDMHGQCSLATRAWAADELDRLIADREHWEGRWREKCDRLTADLAEYKNIATDAVATTHRLESALEQIAAWRRGDNDMRFVVNKMAAIASEALRGKDK